MAAVKDEIVAAELFSRLQIRGELGYLPNSTKPASGWFKKLHNGSEQVYCLLRLEEGRPKEIRMWYANGSPAVVTAVDDAQNLQALIEGINQVRNSEQFSAGEADRRDSTVVWYHDGRKEHFHHINIQRDGLLTVWHENGQKAWEEDDESWTTWYDNGLRRAEGHYKNGKEEGLETWWHENGQKQFEAHKKNGKKRRPSDLVAFQWPEKNRVSFRER